MPIDQDLLLSIRENRFSGRVLTLLEQDIEDGDVIKLVDALKYNNHIKELDISHNKISSVGAQSLASLSNLESLDVSSNNIGSEGTTALARSGLQKLNISGNPIGDGIAAFSKAASLIELTASGCNITDKGLTALFLSTSIRKLTLNSNEIIGESLRGIASNSVLKDLDLSQNPLLGDHLCYISQNESLYRLDLTNVLLNPDAISALAKNRSLKELILIQCLISDVSAFSENNTLRKLVLFSNHIKDVGSLSSNTSLTHLDLSSNPISKNVEGDLSKLYMENNDQVFTRTEEFIEASFKKKVLDEPSQSNEKIESNDTFRVKSIQSPIASGPPVGPGKSVEIKKEHELLEQQPHSEQGRQPESIIPAFNGSKQQSKNKRKATEKLERPGEHQPKFAYSNGTDYDKSKSIKLMGVNRRTTS